MFKKVTSSPAWEKATMIVAKLPPHYPVLSATELLRGKQIKPLITQLQTLAFVPEPIFEEYYLKILHHYAEFVQGLPASQVENFNYHGGLLELGIRRALQTLAWYRREYPIRQYTPEQVPVRQVIWSYALFTAGLFYNLGQLVATYFIMLCEENGASIQRWNPVAGAMPKEKFYRYSFENIKRDDLAARSTPGLALVNMSAEKVGWIATDLDIYNQWLAILLNDADHAGLFAKFILPIDAELTQQANVEAGFIIGENIKHYDLAITPTDETDKMQVAAEAAVVPGGVDIERNPSQPDSPVKNFASGRQITSHDISSSLAHGEIGTVFMQWLLQELKAKNIHGSQIVLTSAGLYVTLDLAQKFSAANSQFGSAQDAFNALKNSPLTLGLAHKQAASSLVMAAGNVPAIFMDPTALLKRIPEVDIKSNIAPVGSPFPVVVPDTAPTIQMRGPTPAA
jgi:hypothetical protein